MNTKKTTKANLENKRNSFLLIGFSIATAFVLMAFEWGTAVIHSETVSKIEEKPYTLENIINEFELELTQPEEMVKSEVTEVNNELIEVTTAIEVENKEENEGAELIIPDLTNQKIIDAPDRKLKTVNPSEVEPKDPYDPSDINIDVPYYEFCKDKSRQEKITCISKEIHKTLSSQLSNLSTYQLENNKKDKMYVKFVISETGIIEDIIIANEHLYDKGVLKMVMNALPKVPVMFPASKNGKPVRVNFTLPINFEIQ